VLKLGVRRRSPVVARALLLLVVGVLGMHSLAAGGMSGMGTTSGTSASGAAGLVVASTDYACLGAPARGSAPHSMGHHCVAVLTSGAGVLLGLVVPVASALGHLPDRTPASPLREAGAVLDRAPPGPAPSLAELSILRV